MAKRKRGLGRGLGALIPDTPEEQPENAAGEESTPAIEQVTPSPSPEEVSRETNTDSEQDSRDTKAGQGKVSRETAFASAAITEQRSEIGDGVSGQVNSANTQVSRETEETAPADERNILQVVPGAEFRELPPEVIRPNAKQPRSVFDEDEMAELVHSLQTIGMLQPVVVRPMPPENEPAGSAYELIMGERRWRAAQKAGLKVIPVIVRQTHDDDMLRHALLENLHRVQLNPLEEAAAYAQLLEDFGGTHEELAEKIGRSRPQISNTIRLLNLPPLVARRVAAGVLSSGHARALLRLDSSAAMESLAQRVVAEGLSVRKVEEIVALGDAGKPKTPARRPRMIDPEMAVLGTRLGDKLDTRVVVTKNQRGRGKIVIEFATAEDLDRIMNLLPNDEK